MSSNTRFALGLVAIISAMTALIMAIQIPFKAIGWFRLRSDGYAPYMEEIALGAAAVFAISALVFWKAPMPQSRAHDREPRHAWVSNARSDGSLGRRLMFDDWKRDEETALDRMRRNQTAVPLSDDEVPRSFFEYVESEDDAPYVDHLGDLIISGYVLVSDRMADVLNRFDLGRSRLVPLKAIYARDRRTPLPGRYFLFNFGEDKTAFDPEPSRPDTNRQVMQGVPIWTLKLEEARDDAVVLNSAAADGPDFWLDPTTPLSFYLSDRLMQALKDAGLAWPWSAKRCRIQSD